MTRHLYEVTLRGTWSRPNTTQQEINTWRRMIRDQAKTEDFEIEPIARRKPFLDRNKQPRWGTFVAYGMRVWAPSQRTAITRASRWLRELVADKTCRTPEINIDRDRSRARWT